MSLILDYFELLYGNITEEKIVNSSKEVIDEYFYCNKLKFGFERYIKTVRTYDNLKEHVNINFIRDLYVLYYINPRCPNVFLRAIKEKNYKIIFLIIDTENYNVSILKFDELDKKIQDRLLLSPHFLENYKLKVNSLRSIMFRPEMINIIDMNHRNIHGDNFLNLVCQNTREDIIDLLIEKGLITKSVVNNVNCFGEDALNQCLTRSIKEKLLPFYTKKDRVKHYKRTFYNFICH